MINKSFRLKAVDEYGYPSMDYEIFYQQGVECYCWGLPRYLIKQAFKKVSTDWLARNKAIHTWQMKAFIDGTRGRSEIGQHEICVDSHYQWPKPIDASWGIVICAYPDGYCEMDMLHPVSRVFWSEENGFLEHPVSSTRTLNRYWYERMGFDILYMHPDMEVVTDIAEPHLKIVR